jgi:hypothetical protein
MGEKSLNPDMGISKIMHFCGIEFCGICLWSATGTGKSAPWSGRNRKSLCGPRGTGSAGRAPAEMEGFLTIKETSNNDSH